MSIAATRSSSDPVHLLVSDIHASAGSRLQVERIDAAGLERHEAAWTDLVARAIEPNIFLEPGFAFPLLRHAGLAGRQGFMLVWEEQVPAFGRLVGLFPIVTTRLTGIARGWGHNQICSGAPLVDASRAADVLAVLFSWLGSRRGIDVLAFRLVARNAPFFDALRQVCEASSRDLEVIEEHSRAVLRRDQGGDARIASFISAKRRKEHARLSRRLSALGARTYTSACAPADVADSVERFLALEHAGWKGAKGTSFLAVPGLAAFVRDLTRTLARAGKCRIEAIEIDGRPAAMGIILVAGETAYFWKTAFDETLASLSPGVQFVLELTRRLFADPAISSTDSCAVADHPMIDRIWPDRLVVSDVIVATRPDDTRRFRRRVWLVRLGYDLRQRAKATWQRLRRLKPLAWLRS